MIRRKTRKKI